jgi:hypothetical protein
MKNAPSNKDEMRQFKREQKIKKTQRPNGFGGWHIDHKFKEWVDKRK